MGVMDKLKSGITRAKELGHTEVTTDMIRSLEPEHKGSVLSALRALGYVVHYRGPMTLNFPHHFIKFRKKS